MVLEADICLPNLACREHKTDNSGPAFANVQEISVRNRLAQDHVLQTSLAQGHVKGLKEPNAKGMMKRVM
jgi:hypothetical protein